MRDRGARDQHHVEVGNTQSPPSASILVVAFDRTPRDPADDDEGAKGSPPMEPAAVSLEVSKQAMQQVVDTQCEDPERDGRHGVDS